MKLKDLFNLKVNKAGDLLESDETFTFYLIHKPSKNVIHHCTTPYPSRIIAEWSAINYYNWFLQDKYSRDEIVIGIAAGIPEIIDSENVRPSL